MKNIKKQITLFLTLIVFESSFVFSFSLDKIYASGYNTVNEFQVSAVKSSTSKSSYKSSSSYKSTSSSKPKSSSYKKSKITTIKPSSGSFSTNSSSSYKSSASSSSSPN